MTISTSIKDYLRVVSFLYIDTDSIKKIHFGVVSTYEYKNNTRSHRGIINIDQCSSPVKVSIKEYLQ